jgi:hypothetical protein
MPTLPNFTAPIMAFLLTFGLATITPSQSFGAVTFGSGYGVSADVSTASDCPSFCTGDFDFDSSGGEYAGFASATSTVYGESRAQAFYNQSEAYLPELKAFSSSTAGRGGSAGAFGVQGFSYEGTESREITIDFELDANVLDSGSFGNERASASIGVLGLDALNSIGSVDGPFYYGHFGTWYFENIGTQLGTDSLFVNSPNGSEQGSISFNVDPGDVFFVGASLNASSRTGTADAFNTFTSTFADPNVKSQLTIANAVSSVPEPTSLACLSIVTVSWAARRRRQPKAKRATDKLRANRE